MNKKLLYLILMISTSIWSQDLYVSSGGNITIKSTSNIHVSGNISVDASGSLVAESDATHSASLINNGSVTGNVTYSRYVPATGTSWNHIAPPVGTQDVLSFVLASENAIRTGTAGNYALAVWESANNSGEKWAYHNESPTTATQQDIGNFENGQGYSTSRTSSGTYTFTGGVTTSDVTKYIGGAGSNWTAIGNPYPAYLSAKAVYEANTTVLNEAALGMYLWDPTTAQWVVFNASSSDQQLHPGKGFLVKSKAGAQVTDTQSFVFPSSLRVFQGTTDTFLRTTPVKKVVIHLNSANAVSATTLKYFSSTTSGFDLGWDAAAFDGQSTTFSINTQLVEDSEGVDYTLQCLNENDYQSNVVSLSVKTGANEPITFFAETQNLPANMDVYLEDKLNGTIQKINDTSYTITPSEALDGIGNFYLHTSSTTLTYEDLTALESNWNVYKKDNRTLFISGLQQNERASLLLYNALGQKMFSTDYAIQNTNEVSIPNLKAGLYIVKISTEVKQYTKKIIIE